MSMTGRKRGRPRTFRLRERAAIRFDIELDRLAFLESRMPGATGPAIARFAIEKLYERYKRTVKEGEAEVIAAAKSAGPAAIGRAFQRARKLTGKTQVEVAEMSGKSAIAVAMFESGKSPVSMASLTLMAGMLGLGVEVRFVRIVPQDEELKQALES